MTVTLNPEISVVLPAYNEVDNIEPLIAEFRQVLEPTGKPYEIIYVDDASSDGTAEKLAALQKEMPFLRVLVHERNYGESAAILSGYETARGDVVVTMDSDLQNDPNDLPKLMAEIDKGADAVLGVRQKRQDSWVKRMSSRVANRTRAFILNDGISDAGCTFRVVRRCALKGLFGFKSLHRFQGTLLKWHGFKVVEVPINHRPRTRGVSKYGIGNRLWVGLFDLIGMRWYRARHLPPYRTR